MQTSFLDMLPPQAQAQLGLIAAMVTLAGLILWAAGIKIAHAGVAFSLGTIAAAFAALLLPNPTGMSPFTCGIVGFVAGLLVGALAFRLLQGVTLALCLGLAVAGIYDRWHLHPPILTATTVTSTPAVAVERATAPASQPAMSIDGMVRSFRDRFTDRWNSIPRFHQQRIALFSIAAAIIALFVALSAPRHTTWVITALLGALLLLAGSFALLHVYAPPYQFVFSANTLPRYSMLSVATLLGMLIQRLFFWPKLKPTPLYKTENPIPNVMPPGPPGK